MFFLVSKINFEHKKGKEKDFLFCKLLITFVILLKTFYTIVLFQTAKGPGKNVFLYTTLRFYAYTFSDRIYYTMG